MAAIVKIDGAAPARLDKGWRMVSTPPGAWADPGSIPTDAVWIDARVPGTAAAALQDAGRLDVAEPPDLDACDVWFVTAFVAATAESLHFGGLATLAEVFLDGRLRLTSDNMFHAHDVAVETAGPHDLHICCRALAPALGQKRQRARWRTRVAAPANLRFVRTSLLGHMPGWCPPLTPVGPWRAVERRAAKPLLRRVDLRTRLDGATGVLDIGLDLDRMPTDARVTCAGATAPLERAADGRWHGTLRLQNIAPWWPHTHGDPVLHDAALLLDGHEITIGRVGFRTIAVTRGADGTGFALSVNGVPIFCRGACWTSADLVGFSDKADACKPLLELARDAGMNMIRIGGTGIYESDAFYRCCDDVGLLVWQDFMFASFDYPAQDQAFIASARAEARQFLDRTQASPSIAILCGASEVGLQAAMFGLAAAHWSNPLFDVELAAIAADLRPDVPYVTQTPFGGELPFVPAIGTSHYYGVSAHKRPLEDARRAEVKFATECLAFANVPDGIEVALDPDAPTTIHPPFIPHVVGDTNSDWHFEDVRNHYLALLYGVDPAASRAADPARFLDLSRAVSAEVMEAVFADWRRPGAPTSGGLVWFLRDLWPGASWGIVDSNGGPKAAYHGLRRAFRPQTVLLSDEGLNGLRLHILNERPTPFVGRVALTCLQDGHVPVMRATRDVQLPPRASLTLPATDLWGGFFDTAYAYRFGPPSHDVTVARLTREDGGFVADAFHFPLGRGAAVTDVGLEADLACRDGIWCLDVAAKKFAQSVHVRDAAYRPDEHWFHLAPGHPRTIRLLADRQAGQPPRGTIAALNGTTIAY